MTWTDSLQRWWRDRTAGRPETSPRTPTTPEGGASSSPGTAEAIMTANELLNAQAICRAARETGVPLPIAAAFAEQESDGRMIYGHDAGGVFSTDPEPVTMDGRTYAGEEARVPMTPANWVEFQRRVIDGNEPTNGVGIYQLTALDFLLEARAEGLDLSDPLDNCRKGLRLIAGYLAQTPPSGVSNLTHAASLYNRGEWRGEYFYTRDIRAKVARWQALLGDAA